MSAIQVIHQDRVPKTGFLAIPGRLDFNQLLHLEKSLQGRKITYLIEENDHHDPAIRGFMEKSESGAMFSISDKNPAGAGKQLAGYLKDNGILLFVPGRSVARPATPVHIPSPILKTLASFDLPTLPIAIDCPRESYLGIEKPSSLPLAVIAFGKLLEAKSSSLPAIQANMLQVFEEAYSSRTNPQRLPCHRAASRTEEQRRRQACRWIGRRYPPILKNPTRSHRTFEAHQGGHRQNPRRHRAPPRKRRTHREPRGPSSQEKSR